MPHDRSFWFGKEDWYIEWYPLGDEEALDGYCSIFLLIQEYEGTELEVLRVQWSFTIEFDNEKKERSFDYNFGVNRDGDLQTSSS